MERVGTLIDKLKDQYDQQADADKLALTAQLLLAELQMQKCVKAVPGKVSVVMPQVAVQQNFEMPLFANTSKPAPKKEEATGWLFDTSIEIPTLIHQNAVTSVMNETLVKHVPSMNERLKENKTEVATMLDETPVRDLKKAISINDRYLFVNTLFRGDENMYERSIKTINGFNIYAEAQYWIQRELKVKLSWTDNNETVQLFDQLVKRRFN